jgi:glutamate dehydrogenase (NAD(P)+)
MAAKFMADKGFTIVAVADIAGTIYHPDGLPLEKLFAAKDERGTIDRARMPQDCQILDRDEWLNLDVDILVPAAIGDAIRKDNVSGVKAKLVVEGANFPVTEEAERYFYQHGIANVPDFVANAGAAGGFGMLLTGQVPLDPRKILEALSSRLRETTRKVLSMSKEKGTSPRFVALGLAEERLRETGQL